ncbi:MAG: ATP-dependent sacrificial sulfur transferase LarE [Bacillota bacterium]
MESASKYGMLVDYLEKLGSVLVGFSGGVDSALLLAAALDALGRERVLAVTAASPIHPPEELAEARQLAVTLGARWRAVESGEMENADFLANPPERCYYCKKERLALLAEMAAGEGLARVVEGSNRSDLNDFRPGFRAVREAGALSPLIEVGMNKEEIREAARKRGISSWNKPSNACLCSRIPYGEKITIERLQRIYLAEEVVRSMGVSTVRVRDHGGIARVEVPAGEIEKICREENRMHIAQKLSGLGYKYVAVDLKGYRTGSMNP